MRIPKLFTFILLTSATLFLSCKKNEHDMSHTTGPGHTHTAVHPHDQNKMMIAMDNAMMPIDTMKHSGDPDHDFSMMMKVHHTAAIKMAEEELKTGDNAKMRETATMVINAQNKEIEQFDSFMMAHQPMGMDMKFVDESKVAMDKMEAEADNSLLTADTDHDFATLMIPHHQSAIDMATSYLKYGKVERIRQMAQKIIDDQKKEIAELHTWLKDN